MTKPREKTREELTAEIEEGKKKIRQFENREKIIKQKLSVEERKARNHRLCKRGGFMESLVPELIAMPDEDAKAFLRLALMSEPAQEFLKKRAGDGNAVVTALIGIVLMVVNKIDRTKNDMVMDMPFVYVGS